MDIQLVEPDLNDSDVEVSSANFIESNTEPIALNELRDKTIIPVHLKSNEPTISQADFIDATLQTAMHCFRGYRILKPAIRVSHKQLGRIPEAKHKAAKELKEHEKTLYYERMAFMIEVPEITESIGGNELSLSLGGIKSYSLDNLQGKKGTPEHFKFFIGFKNFVCTNLCIWTDGFSETLKVTSINQLIKDVNRVIESFDAKKQLDELNTLGEYHLTERQFAQMVGRARLYNHLPAERKKSIPPLLMSDTQVNMVAREYYQNENFARDEMGIINLWKLYNLFTGANKSSYIDTFVDRGVNASNFVFQIRNAMDKKEPFWFLN